MAISSRETGKPLAMEMVPVGNHHAEKQGIQPEMRGREVPLPVKRHDVWVPLPVKRYHGFGVCQARHQHRGRHRHKHLWNGREWVVLAISRLSDHKEQRQRQVDIEMLFHGKRPEVPRRSLPVALDKKEVVHNVPPDLVLDGKWMLQEMGLVIPSATGSVMGSLPSAHTGVGSATNGSFMQVGGALGVAVVGSLLSTRYQHRISDTLAPFHVPQAVEQTIRGS